MQRSLICYWVFNGVYFTIGVATAMLVVSWGKLRSRLWVFSAVVVLGLAIGIIATDGVGGLGSYGAVDAVRRDVDRDVVRGRGEHGGTPWFR